MSLKFPFKFHHSLSSTIYTAKLRENQYDTVDVYWTDDDGREDSVDYYLAGVVNNINAGQWVIIEETTIDPLVEIRQSEYTSLIEEINLLQELLAEANIKLAGLESQEFKPIAEMAYVDWQDIWDDDNPPRFLTSTGEIWTAEYLFKDAEYGYTVAFHQDDSTYSPDGDRLMTDGVDVKIIKRIK